MFELCAHCVFAGALIAAAGSLRAEGILAKTFENAGAEMAVEKIDQSSPADLIVIKGGLREGLRAGVVCEAENPDGGVAKLMIAESSLTKSVALAIGGADAKAGSPVKFNIAK
ncbi:MAG: hypothetical protein J6T16_01055 [Opitutales bacterium]|nr:hypothetical protein [Opitutales bacterium]